MLESGVWRDMKENASIMVKNDSNGIDIGAVALRGSCGHSTYVAIGTV